jgi:hypothetical protein
VTIVFPRWSPIALTFLILTACHRSRPVDANIVETVAGNDDNNFIAAEFRRETALLVPSAGMSWRWDATHTTASYGPSPTVTTFSIACSADHQQVIFRRFLGARGSSTGTISFTGNGHVASLSAASAGDTGSQAGVWQAAASTPDQIANVAKVFTGTAPAQIAVSGSTEFVTAASPIAQQPFAACSH